MVSESKKRLVQDLAKKIRESPVVGVLNLENLPAQQLQKMRSTLAKKKVSIVMAKKKLLQLAFKDSKKENIEELGAKVTGMPALLFSEENPFALYSLLQKNKSKAPAKEGQKAPRDIVVNAGPTSFAPGPIISELASVGIKTKVDAGKLLILDDVTVAKEGSVISGKQAETLKRLDIQPMEIGLDLVAAWENGLVFSAKQLRIDEAEYLQNFNQAAQWAVNLAVEAAYPADSVVEMLLQKAFREAKALALEQNIINEETRDEILAKAERQALSLKEESGIETSMEPKALQESAAQKEVEEEEEMVGGSAEAVVVAHPQEASPNAGMPLGVQGNKMHPKQGEVTHDQAEELFKQLQKKGTLR